MTKKIDNPSQKQRRRVVVASSAFERWELSGVVHFFQRIEGTITMEATVRMERMSTPPLLGKYPIM
jgi:hypothetical protein